MMHEYPDTRLYIGGRWRDGTEGRLPVVNPASEREVGTVASAGESDLKDSVLAAERGFQRWRGTSAVERSRLLRRAAEGLRRNGEKIAALTTIEQGKPLVESRQEISAAADTLEWFSEECRRAYGYVVPARRLDVTQMVLKEAVVPVAAFTPWNFPISQAVRKISAALAAGCSIVLKGPEETPAGCAQLMEVFAEVGVPEGVVNLVYGVPSKVSSYLVAHPTIKKISFTGSTAVGKQLAALAGSHMKRTTMELGGHAPVIVFSDATIERALDILVANKFRNAGQNCVAPTRFLIHEAIFDAFVDGFVSRTRAIKVDDGFASGAEMGPLANDRRLAAMEMLTSDALQRGGKILTGGVRVGNRGFFFQPTVLTDVPIAARIMNEEPFGPVAIISRFKAYGDALSEANRLSYGLGAYVYTTSAKLMADVGRDIESGMVAINHHGFGLPELPFGGVKDSGYGRENGSEALEAYLQTKIITQLVE